MLYRRMKDNSTIFIYSTIETCTDIAPDHFKTLQKFTENVFLRVVALLSFQNVCVHSDNKNNFQVVLGSIHLGKTEPAQQTLEVIETIIHEQYTETFDSVYNDVGDHCLFCTY